MYPSNGTSQYQSGNATQETGETKANLMFVLPICGAELLFIVLALTFICCHFKCKDKEDDEEKRFYDPNELLDKDADNEDTNVDEEQQETPVPAPVPVIVEEVVEEKPNYDINWEDGESRIEQTPVVEPVPVPAPAPVFEKSAAQLLYEEWLRVNGQQ